MRQINRPLRRFGPLGIAASLGGALICAVALAGCGGPPRTHSAFAAQSALPPRAVVQPACYSRCTAKLLILPRRSTVKPNQQITLTDRWVTCFPPHGGCEWERVGADWSSSGGSLKVARRNTKATFSASSPGAYTVHAMYYTVRAGATV